MLRAVQKGNWKTADKLASSIRDPLGIKLYDWLTFTQGSRHAWNNGKYIRLVQFIRQNPEWPQTRSLRLLAEDVMPKSLSDADVIAWHDDYKPLTTRGLERYLQALLSSSQEAKAKGVLTSWWKATPSSRDEQRNIYKKYNKYITREAHIQRLDALLYARQYSNAIAIAGVLGDGYPQLAKARIALAKNNKNGVSSLINEVPVALRENPGLMYERLRWRRRNKLNFRAMEILHVPPPVAKIHNPRDWWQERHIIIRRLLEEGKYNSAYLLAREHIQETGLPYVQAEWMVGWLALRFRDKPEEALEKFQSLYSIVKTPISKTRAAYWAGRAAKSLNQEELATQWYRKAALHQTAYYGQIAGRELTLKGELPSIAPPVLTQEDKDILEAHDLMQAARLFHAAGNRRQTSRFMQAFVSEVGTSKAYSYVAQEAAKMNHHHDAIRISKKATKKGLFLTAQSYPIITNNLPSAGVEWALIHALIRQESMFDFKANSPAGALGLMQLMPATAKEVAHKAKVKHRTGWLTTKPEHNINLGTRYMKQMLDRFGGSYPLAIAAYNAGPSRVQSWIKKFGDPRLGKVNMVDWVEMIPIYETRNYVQRVMEGVYIYRLRLKNIQIMPKDDLYLAMLQ